MATLNSARAHELGLAATFGGIVFGQSGLGRAVKVLPNENDRSKVLEESWRTFAVPKAIGVIAAGATWLIGRALFSGRFMGRGMRRLVIAKDVALGITVLSGIGAQVVGRQLSNEQPYPVQAEGQPSPQTPDKAAADRLDPWLRPTARGRHGARADVRAEHPRAQEPGLERHRARVAVAAGRTRGPG